MGLLLIVAAMGISGYASWRWLWTRESRFGRLTAEAGPCEHVAAAATCGVTLWIGTQWLLAFTRLLFAPAILLTSAAFIALGTAAIVVQRAFSTLRRPIDRPLGVLVAVVPIALWFLYAAARGYVLPIVAPDANIYHLPKALLLLRAHGYDRFAYPDFRVTSYPCDYELVLAAVLAIDRSDHGTACVALVFFALLLFTTAAQAERAGAERTGVLVSVLLVASAPSALLLSGEHKSDMLAVWAAAASFLWLGRWVARAERVYGVLVLACVGITVGTKPWGAFVALVAAPVFLVGLVRSLHASRRPGQDVLVHAFAAFASFALLGGAVLVVNLAATGSPFGVAPSLSADVGYGAWRNLVQFPYLLLAVPFSSTHVDVYVPWQKERWFWPAYDMHHSHYGALFTPAALVLPAIAALDLARSKTSPERTSRLVTVAASVGAALVNLPMRLSPSQDGNYNFFPRYLLYVAPAVLAYVVPALLRPGLARAAAARWQAMAVAGASAVFVWTAVVVAVKDQYAPLSFAWQRFVRADSDPSPLPETFARLDRAAFWIDRLAGPRDRVLFDAGMDAWTYGSFGADGMRPVTFVPQTATAPLSLPDDVQWVAVDRAYRVIWGDPAFKTMADAPAHFFRGAPAPEDLRTENQLDADPRFRLVFRSYHANQALYQRRQAGTAKKDDPRPVIVPPLPPLQ